MPLRHFKPAQYGQQLSNKANTFQALFSTLDIPALEIYSSCQQSFRMRAEFRIWHEEQRCFYAMFSAEDKSKPVEITEFPIASTTIQNAMPGLLSLIQQNEILKNRLFQVEFLSSTNDELLITLIYHKPLDEAWQEQASKLEQSLQCSIIGRSRKQRLVLSKDFITESLEVSGKNFQYQQLENSFTQPNSFINQRMLNWASDCSKNNSGDLLELYCGNGNFTLPLSRNFNKVLATEMAKSGIQSAIYNQQINAIDNIKLARLRAEEVADALAGVREFRRLKDINLAEYNFSTIFVDPPRAGIDPGTLKLMQDFDHIIYISCNPETLRSNLDTLLETHSVERIAIFDQFPYTPHLEAGVKLVRK